MTTWLRVRAIVAGLGLVALTMAGCTSDSDAEPVKPISALNATQAPLLPEKPNELPAFDFAKFQDLGRELIGVPLVVNIWSSWCGPCRSEAPELAAAARTYGTQVQFLGIDIKDDRDAAATFIQKYHVPYPSLFNPSGDIRDNLGFIGQPETLFYDGNGELSATWIGPLPSDELRRQITAILPDAAAGS